MNNSCYLSPIWPMKFSHLLILYIVYTNPAGKARQMKDRVSITKPEIIHTMNLIISRTFKGLDQIPSEIVKLILEDQIIV